MVFRNGALQDYRSKDPPDSTEIEDMLFMSYTIWLFAFSLLFVALERLRPKRRMAIARPGFWNDLCYLVFNGHYLGVLLGAGTVHVVDALDRILDLAHARAFFYLGLMSDQPLWLQALLLLIVFDLCQWFIHRSLHRIPRLWRFHQVHHSVVSFDWMSNWRFHWFEVVLYKSLLYVPAAVFGFSAPAMFLHALFSTFMGNFSHSNLRASLGPLRYLLNSPDMHIWHHSHPEAGPTDRNFGIVLSLWDWLFGTAYLPRGRDPVKLAFEGIEKYPSTAWGQLWAPLRPSRP